MLYQIKLSEDTVIISYVYKEIILNSNYCLHW